MGLHIHMLCLDLKIPPLRKTSRVQRSKLPRHKHQKAQSDYLTHLPGKTAGLGNKAASLLSLPLCLLLLGLTLLCVPSARKLLVAINHSERKPRAWRSSVLHRPEHTL